MPELTYEERLAEEKRMELERFAKLRQTAGAVAAAIRNALTQEAA